MRRHFVLAAVFMLSAAHALAQATPQPPKAPPAPAPAASPVPAPPAPPGPPRQPINIRVDTTISESGGTGAPVKKTVTAVAGDGFEASVRETAANAPLAPPGGFVPGPTALNVDAAPTILPNGKIRLKVTLQYAAGQAQTSDPKEPRIRTDIRQTLVLIVESGKPLVISEASDPVSDRHVTVEVTATILR